MSALSLTGGGFATRAVWIRPNLAPPNGEARVGVLDRASRRNPSARAMAGGPVAHQLGLEG